MKAKPNLARLAKLSKAIRRDIIYYSYKAHAAHISSSLSIADILTVLYGGVLRVSAATLSSPRRDRFILSKGHAAIALYACLANTGYISKKLLRSYGSDGTKLAVHPERGIPAIELSTGSLGHGLSVGAGMALASVLDRKRYRVFVLVSDAELNEGSVWETLQFAAHHRLDNLTMIVDDNGLQALGKTAEVLNIQPIAKKIAAFGWNVRTVRGHNHAQLWQALTGRPRVKNRPNAIVAKTVAGYGISFMEHQLAWHYRNLDDKLYRQAIFENAQR